MAITIILGQGTPGYYNLFRAAITMWGPGPGNDDLEDCFETLLEPFRAKIDLDTKQITFESEHGYTLFLLRYA